MPPANPVELAFADQIDAGRRAAACHHLITATVRQILVPATGVAPGELRCRNRRSRPTSGKVAIFGGGEFPESFKANR